jgi:hypothetical protein
VSETGMMQRRKFVAGIAGLVAAGATGPRLWAALPGGLAPIPINVYKSSTCDCCTKWVEHIRTSGFAPIVHDHEEMEALKDEMGVPPGVRSCHTGIVEKYLIEGHVPASDIRRLLAERPKTAGLAVPGMPPLTPGMAPAGIKPKDFDVVSFKPDGSTTLFSRH